MSRAHHDLESIKSHKRLDVKKKHPSGNFHVGDEVIKSCADAIVSCSSTTAWSMCCHCIRPLSVLLENTDAQENINNELVHLSTSHLKISKSGMFDHFKASVEKNVLERLYFYSVARRLTRNQDRSLRALDCNIIDILHEPKKCPRTMIESFSTPENISAVKLL